MRPVQTDNLEHLVDYEINFSYNQHFNIMKKKRVCMAHSMH